MSARSGEPVPALLRQTLQRGAYWLFGGRRKPRMELTA
jgi:hypothetical protein